MTSHPATLAAIAHELEKVFPPPHDDHYRSILEKHIASLAEIQEQAIHVWRQQFRSRIVKSIFIGVGTRDEDAQFVRTANAANRDELLEELLEQFEAEIAQFGKRVRKLLERVVDRDDFLPPLP